MKQSTQLADMHRQILLSRVVNWLNSGAAQNLQCWEQRQLAEVLPLVLGYRLLQIGPWPLAVDTLGGSAILHRWVLASREWGQNAVQANMLGDEGQLPVASRSVDAVLLPHSLELARDPHALLREVDRVLCQRGQLIILGFNPLSLWRLGSYLPGKQHMRYPRQARLYTCGRIADWLGLLDFEVETLAHYGETLPWTGDVSQFTDARRWLAPLSQAYMLFARKRVVPLTPARKPWARMPELGPAALPEARVQRLATKQARS